MRLKDILQGIAVGYVAKSIQLIAAVFMLPFILRPDNLGTSGYGVAYSLLTAVFAYDLITDGIKTACAKRISKSVLTGNTGIILGESARIMLFVGSAFTIILLTQSEEFLILLGIEVKADNITAVRVIAINILVSSINTSFSSLLFSLGKITAVNIIGIVAVLIKNAFYLVCFTVLTNNVTIFVSGLLLAESLALGCYLIYIVASLKKYSEGFFSIRILFNTSILKEAFSIGLVSVYSLLFLRFSVPLVNRHLGAEAAGLMSIVLNIADNYLRQALSSIIQPLVVPLVSRIRLRQLSLQKRQLIWDIDSAYSAVCIVSLNMLISVVPIIIPLWLGHSFSGIVLSTQCMVFSVMCQLTSLFKKGFVISEDHTVKLIPYSSLFALLSFAALFYSVLILQSWKLALLVVSIFMILHTIGSIGLVFDKYILHQEEKAVRNQKNLIIALITSFGITLAISQFTTVNIFNALFAIFMSAIVSIFIVHVFLINITRLVKVFVKLKTNYATSLF